MVRVEGYAPSTQECKSRIILFNYTRIKKFLQDLKCFSDLSYIPNWSQVSVPPRLQQVYKTRWIAESQGKFWCQRRELRSNSKRLMKPSSLLGHWLFKNYITPDSCIKTGLFSFTNPFLYPF